MKDEIDKTNIDKGDTASRPGGISDGDNGGKEPDGLGEAAISPGEERESQSTDSDSISLEEADLEEGRMSVIDHLEELRTRIIKSLLAWGLGTLICWYLSPYIITYIKAFPQLKDVELILIRPPEAFFVRLKIAVAAGLMLSLPLLVYQAFGFIMPALFKKERTWLLRFIPASMILFYAGAAFALFAIIPITLDFFLVQMAKGIAKPQISLGEYVNYLVSMTLVGGLVFQMPIVLFFLTVIGILTSDKLRAGRKYAILGIFILAAVATPPDAFSQVMVALPMIALYELCIWAAKLAKK